MEKSEIEVSPIAGDRGWGLPTFENLLSKAWGNFFKVLLWYINVGFYQRKLNIIVFSQYHWIPHLKRLSKLLQKIVDFSIQSYKAAQRQPAALFYVAANILVDFGIIKMVVTILILYFNSFIGKLCKGQLSKFNFFTFSYCFRFFINVF